ncbi:DUF418 domain-containing protein [Spirillospora sp. CA-294931]|uniref:DUF418 domain-containing protein n=1 Tax=Spirillospora sp. CA-294931 TaxID=3240042 RepID=UPI003D92CD9D
MPQNASPPLTLPEAPAAPSTARLVGVDLARGLAVLGMYAVHIGPDPADGGGTGLVMELAHGRSSALFALLAGFSIILMTGRSAPKTGPEGRRAVARVLIRAAVLLVVGTLLTMTGTPVEVILAYYGLFFVLVLPLRGLGPAALAAIALGTALVPPQVLYVIRNASWPETVAGHDPFARASGTDGLVGLLFTGSYPALAWVSFVIAGMALARCDLASAAVRARLAVTGAVLAVTGYGGSWLAFRLVPGLRGDLLTAAEGDRAVLSAWWSARADISYEDTPARMWVAAPHSETTFAILGNTGVAIAVLIACVALLHDRARLTIQARPLTAVGSMSLTVYVFHVVGLHVLGHDELPGSLPLLLGFSATAIAFALVWSHFFARGPLEHVLNTATRLAGRDR